MTIQTLTDVPAPAKLNLFLHITGRRADGYHLLQSVFVTIDWFDTLHFERRSDGHIARHELNKNTPLPEQDLTVRAATLLQQVSGTTAGVDITLQKDIPAQAGLGGGSSDAASTLIALNQLWQLHLSRGQLHALAQELGADVPFFLQPGPAWAEGIGDQLTPLQLPESMFETPVVIVKPQAGVATERIFASPLLTRNMKPVRIADFVAVAADSGGSAGTAFNFGCNALQEAAVDAQPQIGQALAWLAAFTGEPARMSGSGSAVFSAARHHVDPLDQSTKTLPFGWQLKMCKILGEHPLASW